jgi:prepilin-type N-terminal cleavage/methylation domain-containing protein
MQIRTGERLALGVRYYRPWKGGLLMPRQRGFSLIELLIVVAIILIIAAIAIPSLQRSRMAANEASAVAALRVLNNSEVTYAMTYNSGYTDGFNKLGPPAPGQLPTFDAADLVDDQLAGLGPGGTNTTFIKGGYIFTYTPGSTTFGSISFYSIAADPQLRGGTGQRSFFTNEPLVIRANNTAPATASDSPL